MKTFIHCITFIILLLLSFYTQAQTCTSYKALANWTSNGSWSCSGASAYPEDVNGSTGWDGNTIVIASGTQIVVPNNVDITLTQSSAITIIVRGVLDFRANPEILLPAGSSIIIDGGSIIAANQSAKTLISIDGTGVFGKGAGCATNEDLTENGTIDETTVCPTNASLILPVTFTNFYATLANNDVTLNWGTAEEINNSHFVVQESFDGEIFADRGMVIGVGNSVTIQNYSFTLPFHNQTTYYRLKQVDIDGETSYSKTIVQTNQLGEFVLFPNPSSQNVNCVLSSYRGNTQLSVSNQFGEMISNESYNTKLNNNIELSFEHKGVYFVKVTQGNNMNVKKLIIH